jgi:hypothetical protein
MAEGLTLDSGIYRIESLVPSIDLNSDLGGAYATGQGPQQPVRALQGSTQIVRAPVMLDSRLQCHHVSFASPLF